MNKINNNFKFRYLLLFVILALVLISGCSKKNLLTISFDSNGGTLVEDQQIKKRKNITKPTDPIYEGYTFDGWYVDDKKWDFKENKVTENITLTAKYICDVKYEIDENNQVIITGANKQEGDIIILSEYEGKTTKIIGDYAFSSCNSLTSITIPDSITIIGEYAFKDCTSLKKANINNIESWCNISFANYLSNPLYYAHNLYLNNELVTNLVIPDIVKNIGNYTFNNCRSLTSIIIPNSVTNIGNYAFSMCTSLKNVIMPNNITNISSGTFEGCKSLITITIPNSVTNIENYAFYNCPSLTSVIIGNSVSNIRGSAFFGCYRLIEIINKSSLDIKAGSKDNGNIAYYAKQVIEDASYSKLSTNLDGFITYDDGIDTLLVNYIGDDTEIIIPNNVTKINDYAFCFLTSVTDIIIPNNVISIGNMAFYEATSLGSITIPDTITDIGEHIFYHCKGLTKVNINSLEFWSNISFVDFDSNPLYYAHNLYLNNKLITDLVIPNTVTKIGRSTFSDCTSIKTITIPDSVTIIEDYAFYGCKALQNITIPDNVINIKEFAFCDCPSLTSVTIPSSVTNIEWYAFYCCPSLTTIYYKGTIPYTDTLTIGSANTSITNATWYYFTSNGNKETSSGNWWYYDTDGVTIIEKIVH